MMSQDFRSDSVSETLLSPVIVCSDLEGHMQAAADHEL